MPWSRFFMAFEVMYLLGLKGSEETRARIWSSQGTSLCPPTPARRLRPEHKVGGTRTPGWVLPRMHSFSPGDIVLLGLGRPPWRLSASMIQSRVCTACLIQKSLLLGPWLCKEPSTTSMAQIVYIILSFHKICLPMGAEGHPRPLNNFLPNHCMHAFPSAIMLLSSG